MLSRLWRVCPPLDPLTEGLPDVLAKERQFLQGAAQHVVVSRSATVESPHPAPVGVTERVLSIPGAKEMLISASSSCFTMGTGHVAHHLSPARTDGPGAEWQPHQPQPHCARARRHRVRVLQPGYDPNAWGFSVTARAAVEEVRLQLPWLLERRQVRGSAGWALRGCACAQRRDYHGNSEQHCGHRRRRHHCRSGERGAGAEGACVRGGAAGFSASREALAGLGPALPGSGRRQRQRAGYPLAQRRAADQVAAAPRPSLQRQGSHVGVSLGALTSELHSALRASAHGAVEPFPVPSASAESAARAIRAVLAVLIKHNHLVTAVTQFLQQKTAAPPESVLRVWRTAHKLRHWLARSCQQRLGKLQRGTDDDAKDDEDGESKAEAEKVRVYGELCGEVERRCGWLLEVVPAAPHGDGAAPDQPELLRLKSAQGKRAELTEEQRKARGTLLAWQSTKETTELRFASPEERFALLWKMVLSFLSEEQLSLPDLKVAVGARRVRATVRATGLRALGQLIHQSSLATVRREILSSLVPALHPSDRVAYSGAMPELLVALGTCGSDLRAVMEDACLNLYRELLQLLSVPEKAGPHLIQAVLHAFALKQDPTHFSASIQLSVLPTLHELLSSAAHVDKPLAFGEQMPSKSASSFTGAQTSAWGAAGPAGNEHSLVAGRVRARGRRPRAGVCGAGRPAGAHRRRAGARAVHWQQAAVHSREHRQHLRRERTRQL